MRDAASLSVCCGTGPVPGLRRRCPFVAPSRGSLPQRAGAGDSRLCTSRNGTHGSPSRAAPQLEFRVGKRSRPMVPRTTRARAAVGPQGPLAYVYRALGLHRTPPRAPKGCRLCKIGWRPLGARAPSLLETFGGPPRETVKPCALHALTLHPHPGPPPQARGREGKRKGRCRLHFSSPALAKPSFGGGRRGEAKLQRVRSGG